LVTIDNASALQTLDAASDTEAPVSLMVAHMAMSCTGKLRGATVTGVIIELSSAPPETIEAGDRCAVTFPLAGRSAGFTSRVLSSVDGEGGRVRITVEPPEKIQPSEQRMSVRVPVPLGALAVAVMIEESPRSVKPIDVSLDGILIEFPEGEDADIEVGHRRMLVLKRGKHQVLAEAEVRRQAGQRFGLLFMFREGRPKEMIRIVAELQHLWNEV
jgi:hypothetical protein